MFLENVLTQDDGRGPNENINKPQDFETHGTPLIKFIVDDGPPVNNATIGPGGELRDHIQIRENEIERTRHFVFERRHGAWVINGKFFDSQRIDADPRLGSAERWVLENKSGGWDHPIHIHLEAHQLQSLKRRTLELPDMFKKDTVLLGKNERAVMFMKFRTFPGPFVFHCHNLEHEDMRMMLTFNVRE